MQANWSKYTLNFKAPAGTSRGVMLTRDVWYVFLTENGVTGIGECAPLAGLSLDNINEIEAMLDKVCSQPVCYLNKDGTSPLRHFPAIRFALEMAALDLRNGGTGHYFKSPLDTGRAIKINGLIWMGDKGFMLSQIKEKLDAGWQCLKIKIGGLDFEAELELLKTIRRQFSAGVLQLRLDANGAFTQKNVLDRLQQLAAFKAHSIEQPIAPGQFGLLSDLCENSPIPIALDEELIPLLSTSGRKKMLSQVKPHYLVLKPTLLGGFAECEAWMGLAKERNIDCWITSALESNIGLQAISQWTAKQALQRQYQGLGTGQLFTNNVPSGLQVKSGKLHQKNLPVWQDIHQFYTQWLHPQKTLPLQTSGSSGKPKIITMDKASMRASARLTAKTFQLQAGDSALLCLPVDYIAGKMMLVRAMQLKMDLIVVQASATPLEEIRKPSKSIKFAAMTPMQMANTPNRDLQQIDTLIIGGAPLSLALSERLQSISSRVYETYGMTETVSHIAVRPVNGVGKSDWFDALKAVGFERDERGCLVIHAPHLGQETVISNDLVDLKNSRMFKWLGRIDHVINSGGVKIIPEQLEKKLEKHLSGYRYFITASPDEQLGEAVILAIEGEPVALAENIFESLEEYERPRKVVFINRFKKTGSGKIVRSL